MRPRWKAGKGFASIGLPVLAFAVLTALAVIVLRGMSERDRLESRNDAERTMNMLLASLRDHDDFGSAIESFYALKQKVLGVGVYQEDGTRIYSWGDTPKEYVGNLPKEDGRPGDMVRKYIDDPPKNAMILLLHPFRFNPPPSYKDKPRIDDEESKVQGPIQAESAKGSFSVVPPEQGSGERRQQQTGFFFTTLRKGEVVYLEILQDQFWARHRFMVFLFPLIELILAAMIVFVRSLIIRNEDYKRRIEEQKSLVVLGTAASTIAHEIKNPLSSIRLQTRILERTCPDVAQREIAIINDEVERLSALSHRVGDYLREPAGELRLVDPREIAREAGLGICGRDVVRSGAEEPGDSRPLSVEADPERLRSVLDNLLRNAQEAGGSEEELAIEIGREGGTVRIDVLDRGGGLAPEAKKRLFDPFFTTKSRGTGIGLSVCKRFVTAIGGSISLEDRPGGGCRARLLLPAMGGEQ